MSDILSAILGVVSDMCETSDMLGVVSDMLDNVECQTCGVSDMLGGCQTC